MPGVGAAQETDQLLVLAVPVAAAQVRPDRRLAAQQAPRIAGEAGAGLSLVILRSDLVVQAAAVS